VSAVVTATVLTSVLPSDLTQVSETVPVAPMSVVMRTWSCWGATLVMSSGPPV
jgi:hypothetical protein